MVCLPEMGYGMEEHMKMMERMMRQMHKMIRQIHYMVKQMYERDMGNPGKPKTQTTDETGASK